MTEVKEIREKIPCGESVTTQHLQDGKVVRQDIKIIVDEGFLTTGKSGE